jgi:hypothetical protein
MLSKLKANSYSHSSRFCFARLISADKQRRVPDTRPCTPSHSAFFVGKKKDMNKGRRLIQSLTAACCECSPLSRADAVIRVYVSLSQITTAQPTAGVSELTTTHVLRMTAFFLLLFDLFYFPPSSCRAIVQSKWTRVNSPIRSLLVICSMPRLAHVSYPWATATDSTYPIYVVLSIKALAILSPSLLLSPICARRRTRNQQRAHAENREMS